MTVNNYRVLLVDFVDTGHYCACFCFFFSRGIDMRRFLSDILLAILDLMMQSCMNWCVTCSETIKRPKYILFFYYRHINTWIYKNLKSAITRLSARRAAVKVRRRMRAWAEAVNHWNGALGLGGGAVLSYYFCLHSTMTRSSRFHCPVGVINKPTHGELWISPVYRRLAVAKSSTSTI